VKDAKCFCKWLLGWGEVPRENLWVVASAEDVGGTARCVTDEKLQNLPEKNHIETTVEEMFERAGKRWPDTGGRPVQDDIDEAFRALFHKARLGQGRRLYVYFAGHGCSQEIRHVALIMANATAEELNLSLNAREYHEGLARTALFPEQVMFYDCCRNYDRRVLGRGPPWTRDDPAPGAVNVAQFVLFGAGFTEYANERNLIYSERRGLFTHALLEGLHQAAILRNGNWVVTAQSLIEYVTTRLGELARAESLSQQLSRELVGNPNDIVLATLDNLPPVPVTVSMPLGDHGLIVKDNRLQEIMRQAVTGSSITFALPNGYYVLCGDPSGHQCVAHITATAGPQQLTL